MAHHSPGNFFTKGSSVSDIMVIWEWVIDLVFTLYWPYYLLLMKGGVKIVPNLWKTFL